MFPTIRKLCQIKYTSGSISQQTKVGRLAKLMHCKAVEGNQGFDFVAFGEELIGKTVKAICMAQEMTFPDVSGSANFVKKFRVIPYDFVAPGKIRSVPSVRFIIDCVDNRRSQSQEPEIRVSTKTEPDQLAKRLHSLYMNKNKDEFVLRCMGYNSAAKVIQAMVVFNTNVEKHSLSSTISTEIVPDDTNNLRVIIFNANIVNKSPKVDDPRTSLDDN